MKLKELFSYVDMTNKMNKFMKEDNSVGYIALDEHEFKDMEFTTAKQLVDLINENYYTKIDEDIEVVNNGGYMQLFITQYIPEFEYVDGELKKWFKEQEETLTIYIESKQEW